MRSLSSVLFRLVAGLWLAVSIVLPVIADEQEAAIADEQEAGTPPEESPKVQPGGIEQIVVTARRRQENIQEVPIPISAMTGSDLIDRGIRNIKEIERLTPNLTYKADGITRNTAIVYLRGIGQRDWSASNDHKVGIYLDGVYLARPQGSVFDLLDIDRVEVLRGPQGTLFGKNTAAGLVHVISKKPDFDGLSGQLKFGLGNDDQVTTDGVVNIPLIDERLAARFSFMTDEAEGWTTNKTRGNADWNNDRSQAIRGSLLWAINDSAELLLRADWARVRENQNLAKCRWGLPAEIQPEVTHPVGRREPPDPSSFAWSSYLVGTYDDIVEGCNATSEFRGNDDDGGENEVDTLGINATLTWDLGFAELTSISSWWKSDWHEESWGQGTGQYYDVLEGPQGWNKQDQYSQELRLAGTSFDGRFDWVVGGFWFKEKVDQSFFNVFFHQGYRDVTPPTPEEFPVYYNEATALFQEDGTFLYDRFDLGTSPACDEAFSVVPCEFDWAAALFFPEGSTFGDIGEVFTDAFKVSEKYDARHRNWALFFEGTYDLTERFSLTGGVRYTKERREIRRDEWIDNDLTPNLFYYCPGMPLSDGGFVDENGVTRGPDGEETDPFTTFATTSWCKTADRWSGWSPRAILSYQLTDDVLLYGSWSRGFSSGGINHDTRQKRFEQEVADNWEIGFKSTLFDNRLVFNLTAFYNDYQDFQIVVGRLVDTQVVADLINAEQADIRGLEMEMTAHPLDGLVLTATVGLIDPDYRDFEIDDIIADIATGESRVQTTDFSSRDFIEIPRHQFSASAAYTLPLDRFGDLTMRADWSYFGRTYYTLDNLDTSRQNKYGLLAGRMSWALPDGRTEIALWGTNLLDRTYYRTGLDFINQPTARLDYSSRYYAAPRRYGVEVSYRFGG